MTPQVPFHQSKADREADRNAEMWEDFSDAPAPETFEDAIGCDMCGAHIDDPCDCFDPQAERRYRS